MAQTYVNSVRWALLAGALACLAPAMSAAGIDPSRAGDPSPLIPSPWVGVGAQPSRVAPHPRLLSGQSVAPRNRLPTVCWYHHSNDTSGAAGIAGAGNWSTRSPGRLAQTPVYPGARDPYGWGESASGNDELGEELRSAQGPGTLQADPRSPRAGAGIAPPLPTGTNLPAVGYPWGLNAAHKGAPSSGAGNPGGLQHRGASPAAGASFTAPGPWAGPGGGSGGAPRGEAGSPSSSTPPAQPSSTPPRASHGRATHGYRPDRRCVRRRRTGWRIE